MSKICIITAYTDHISWDNYGKYGSDDLSSLNHHAHTNKPSYQYIKKIKNGK